MNWSQQNFAHAMTAGLSWHVQNFVVIYQQVLIDGGTVPSDVDYVGNFLVKLAHKVVMLRIPLWSSRFYMVCLCN